MTIIDKIVNIIGDYRHSEGITLDNAHVTRWINQFDENDREFLLLELFHILPQAYLSDSIVSNWFLELLSEIKDNLHYSSIPALLRETAFLKCQKVGKSQIVLLNMLDMIIIREFKISIFACNLDDAKQWIYLDDILATGGTFYYDILNAISNFGYNKYIAKDTKTICMYFFLHQWGYTTKLKQIGIKLTADGVDSVSIVNSISMYYLNIIENDPCGQDQRFNFVYPLKTNSGSAFINSIEDILGLKYPMRYAQHAFRNPSLPSSESFYSSPENRNRYEQIVLNKGIEIFNSIQNLRVTNTRPLGFTNPTYQLLGTGSHAFTWRNVSNTCPLVYWWNNNGWYPLFPVKNRGM